MNTPLVSIVIPIYNVEAWVRKCLDSCIIQSYENIEILAVNDGSTDNCKKIIEGYCNIDKRVVLIDKPNGGLNSAREAGIKNASGDYITIVDGDDFLEPNAVKLLLSYTEEDDPDIIVGSSRYVKSGSYEVLEGRIGGDTGTLSGIEFVKYVLTREPLPVWMSLYRTSLIQNGSEFPNFVGSEDVVLTIQWGFKAKKIIFMSDVIYNYVVGRPGSILVRGRNKHAESSFECICFLFEWLSQRNRIEKIKKELVNFLCFRLYIYLLNPKNRFRENKNKVRGINDFIFKNRQFISGKQLKMLTRLIRINIVLSHRFVFMMQKIKPTFHPGYKHLI